MKLETTLPRNCDDPTDVLTLISFRLNVFMSVLQTGRECSIKDIPDEKVEEVKKALRKEGFTIKEQ